MRTVKNLLVTGGAGFIGSAFIRYVLSLPDFCGIIVNYDLLEYSGSLENVAEVESDPRYTFVQGDISNQQLVEQLCVSRGIDCIVNFAAETHVDRSIKTPLKFIQTNIIGTFHLLEVVRRHPEIHFHHVSTDEVFGSLEGPGSFHENSPYKPNSPYSASKASSDHFLNAYAATYALSTTLSNCSNNYGPFQFPEKLIPLMILNCLQGLPLPIYGSGANVRDWLYVEDHAEALWDILNRAPRGSSYTIGGGAEKTNLDLVHLLIETLAAIQKVYPQQYTRLIQFVKDRPGHDYRYAIDFSKIQRELGWKPKHNLQKGLEKTIQWYLANPDWVKHVKSEGYSNWIESNYAKR